MRKRKQQAHELPSLFFCSYPVLLSVSGQCVDNWPLLFLRVSPPTPWISIVVPQLTWTLSPPAASSASVMAF